MAACKYHYNVTVIPDKTGKTKDLERFRTDPSKTERNNAKDDLDLL